MSYRIEWAKSAVRELKALPPDIAVRIGGSVGHLAEQPRPPACKKLTGHNDLWRLRIGKYRVIYFISDVIKLVRIEKVSDRKDAYRKR